MASAEVVSPLVSRFENISTIQSLVKTAKVSSLPQRYLLPASIIGSIDGRSNLPLPVIDLAGLRSEDPAARAAIVRQIGSAASDWGFFQIVNHGVPDETIEALDHEAREFFALPVDVKERAQQSENLLYGYDGRMKRLTEGVPWLEYLAQGYHPSSEVEVLAQIIWPHGNATFCNAIHQYCRSADKLGEELLGLLAESLGLDPFEFSRHLQHPEGYISAWRLQHYPACPDPSRTLGARSHSDQGLLTILRQDAVGGLQIRKDGNFVSATPIPGALVVNVGDTLEVLSNGRFRSSDHRVVVNEKCSRLSLVYLFSAASDTVIECPSVLVDEAHPSLYRPFTAGEYRAHHLRMVKSRQIGRKENLRFALRSM